MVRKRNLDRDVNEFLADAAAHRNRKPPQLPEYAAAGTRWNSQEDALGERHGILEQRLQYIANRLKDHGNRALTRARKERELKAREIEIKRKSKEIERLRQALITEAKRKLTSRDLLRAFLDEVSEITGEMEELHEKARAPWDRDKKGRPVLRLNPKHNVRRLQDAKE